MSDSPHHAKSILRLGGPPIVSDFATTGTTIADTLMSARIGAAGALRGFACGDAAGPM